VNSFQSKSEPRIRDPRGQLRTITKIEESCGPTMVTTSCGHRYGRVNHFMYTLGASIRCFQCKDYYPEGEQ
jgi:hypothetical protein